MADLKILVLVLSSKQPVYIKFKENWLLYADSDPRFTVRFLEMDPAVTPAESIRIDGMTVIYSGTDSFIPGCLQKTVNAFNTLDVLQYDYVVRTNLSSVIDFDKLYNHLLTAPRTNYYGGVVINYCNIKFCSGALFILSHDLYEVVAKCTNWNQHPDDVQIGAEMAKFYENMNEKCTYHMLTRYDCVNFNIIPLHDEKTFHYRFRRRNEQQFSLQHRFFDVLSQQKLIHRIYGKLQDEKSARGYIKAMYQEKCKLVADINEHVPTLMRYALYCNSVVECGTRAIVSSWGFLQGLVDPVRKLISPPRPAEQPIEYTLCDLTQSPNTVELEKCATTLGIKYEFVVGNDVVVDLPDADMYFIDTWHVKAHLQVELERFRLKARKFIVMHDVVVDAVHGETIRCDFDAEKQAAESGYAIEDIKCGLQPAIDEFLAKYPNWRVVERFENNNGLLILGNYE